MNEAVSVYERSNLARRHGHWPSRASRVAKVTAKIHDAASWFLIGRLGGEAVAMALVEPFRAQDRTGEGVSGTVFLDLIYVLPELWGKGMGGIVLDGVIHEAARRGSHRIYLWTHELENERAQSLYRSRGFVRTGVTSKDAADELIGEWLHEG